MVAGILAQFEDSGMTTDGTWKCSNTFTEGWSEDSFDETTWNDAFVIGNNGRSPWGLRPDIDPSAKWIWTPAWEGGDLEVWCRKEINPGEASAIVFNVRYHVKCKLQVLPKNRSRLKIATHSMFSGKVTVQHIVQYLRFLIFS